MFYYRKKGAVRNRAKDLYGKANKLINLWVIVFGLEISFSGYSKELAYNDSIHNELGIKY